MYALTLFLSACLVSLNSISQTPAYNNKDLNELNALPAKWQRYWNTHNMDSMGTLLREDVDFVTVTGRWSKGKSEAIKHHKERHSFMFKSSVWQNDSIAIKYVKPDLAILHIGWGMSGDVEADGTPRKPRHGIFTWVVTKQKNKWLLLSVHNVNISATIPAP